MKTLLPLAALLAVPAYASADTPAPRQAAIETSVGASTPRSAGSSDKMMCISLERPGMMIDKKVCKSRQEWLDMGAELRKKKQ